MLLKENPEWCIEDIEQKTGILVRPISGPRQTATDMAMLATEKLFTSRVQKKDAADEKHLKNADKVMLIGFGVGYSWGGCPIRWEAMS